MPRGLPRVSAGGGLRAGAPRDGHPDQVCRRGAAAGDVRKVRDRTRHDRSADPAARARPGGAGGLHAARAAHHIRPAHSRRRRADAAHRPRLWCHPRLGAPAAAHRATKSVGAAAALRLLAADGGARGAAGRRARHHLAGRAAALDGQLAPVVRHALQPSACLPHHPQPHAHAQVCRARHEAAAHPLGDELWAAGHSRGRRVRGRAHADQRVRQAARL
mmetsp:Transcript_3528/g.11027  ORF Transcript_3528/g.11027 Transcript_3528/m.11027 type:complete len:218 (-) Transcript_3528:2056-2709(-)